MSDIDNAKPKSYDLDQLNRILERVLYGSSGKKSAVEYEKVRELERDLGQHVPESWAQNPPPNPRSVDEAAARTVAYMERKGLSDSHEEYEGCL